MAVVTMSKIQKLKAIHNTWQPQTKRTVAVVTMSKIQKLKAIHNRAITQIVRGFSCCDDVKDTKIESHSQPKGQRSKVQQAVVTMSKIQKLRAIHNGLLKEVMDFLTVVTMSKIQKLRAIHNTVFVFKVNLYTVVTVSKIQKLRAIHNTRCPAK